MEAGMRWTPLDTGISWWLENDAGITQGYVVKVEGQYLPCLMNNPKTDLLLRMDTLEAAQEHVLVWLTMQKLEGT
jgi:hypothetical protein